MPVKTACPGCRREISVNTAESLAREQCPSCGAALRPLVADAGPKRSASGPSPAPGNVAPARADTSGRASTAGGSGSAGRTSAAGKSAPGDGPQAPKKLIGPYQIRRELGRGAFGVVLLAHDPALDREVAIKVLNPHALGSRTAVDRFLREARVVAQMHHNHIVPVYQLGEHGGAHYIASKFIPGQALADAIPDGGMDPTRAVDLVLQLLDALAYAHDQNVLHRDVKPANTILDNAGTLYLMDFGLAGWVGQGSQRMTNDGAVMGTPAYMAPEQAAGKTAEVGFAADQYSAGVVLFELLTGQLPFDAPAQVLVYHVINTPAQPPSALRPGLDPRLDELCLRALAKRPEQRFGSCREFSDALRAWRGGTVGPSDGTGRNTRIGMPAVQNPSVNGTVTDGAARGRPSQSRQTASLISQPAGRVIPPGPSRTPLYAALALAFVMLLGLNAWLLSGVVFKTRAQPPAVVMLDVDPAGADVAIDGEPVQVTSPGAGTAVEIKLDPGRHRLRVRKAGFEPANRELDLKSGKTEAVTIRLEPVKLASTSEPPSPEPPSGKSDPRPPEPAPQPAKPEPAPARVVPAQTATPPVKAAAAAPPSNGPSSVVRTGEVFEGGFKSWTPGFGGQLFPLDAEWKMTVGPVTATSFEAEWVWNGDVIQLVKGKILPGNRVQVVFAKNLKGYDVSVEGGSWDGTISAKGEVSGAYRRPSGNRVGKLSGRRVEPAP